MHAVRDMLGFHALFFLIALPCALLLKGSALGQALLWLAIGYNLALPALGFARGHQNWMRLWGFLLPLSCAQVIPDWALVNVAGTLSFPDHGVPRVGGAVPVYFMGLWIMALFPVLLWSETRRAPYSWAALLSFGVFAVWEWAAVPLQLWEPKGVRTVAGVALYPLPAEVLLTLAALALHRLTLDRGPLARLAAALCVPLFYAGALMFSLLVFEHARWL